jgi:hypothetical protein
MDEIARQVGRIIRDALKSWSATARLCLIVAALAAAWICYQAIGR